jgi:hypothetical protein
VRCSGERACRKFFGIEDLSRREGTAGLNRALDDALSGFADERCCDRVDVPATGERSSLIAVSSHGHFDREPLIRAATLVGGDGWRCRRIGQIVQRRHIYVAAQLGEAQVTRDQDRLREGDLNDLLTTEGFREVPRRFTGRLRNRLKSSL